MAAGLSGAVLGRPWGSRYSALPSSKRARTPASESFSRTPSTWVVGSLEIGPESLVWSPRLRALSLALKVTATASVNCKPCSLRETRIPASAPVHMHQQARRQKKWIQAIVNPPEHQLPVCAASDARNSNNVNRVYPG